VFLTINPAWCAEERFLADAACEELNLLSPRISISFALLMHSFKNLLTIMDKNQNDFKRVEYSQAWDEFFYEGVEQGRQMKMEASPITRSLSNLQTGFNLRYEFSQKELADVSGPVKDIFKLIYTTLAQKEAGEKSLLHHEHGGDFFTLAEGLLAKIPGLRKEEAPELWKEIDLLKDKNLPEYQRIGRNIRLLGLLSGVFEQIENMAAPEKPALSVETMGKSIEKNNEIYAAEAVLVSI
jgi:hypothetical protein